MNKIVSVKEIMIILISVLLITFSTTIFATESVLGDNTNNVTTITGNEYNNAQSTTNNNSVNNTKNVSNNTSLPQTGVEDYGIGAMLIICVASAIFAYKKVSDYRNI